MTSELKTRILGAEGCRCRNFDSEKKLLELVLEAVRDSNRGLGANAYQLYQHIRQYHRVPIKDNNLMKIIHAYLAKALGYGFVKRQPGGQYRYITSSHRQARASRMNRKDQIEQMMNSGPSRASSISLPKTRPTISFSRLTGTRLSRMCASVLKKQPVKRASLLSSKLSRKERLSKLERLSTLKRVSVQKKLSKGGKSSKGVRFSIQERFSKGERFSKAGRISRRERFAKVDRLSKLSKIKQGTSDKPIKIRPLQNHESQNMKKLVKFVFEGSSLPPLMPPTHSEKREKLPSRLRTILKSPSPTIPLKPKFSKSDKDKERRSISKEKIKPDKGTNKRKYIEKKKL